MKRQILMFAAIGLPGFLLGCRLLNNAPPKLDTESTRNVVIDPLHLLTYGDLKRAFGSSGLAKTCEQSGINIKYKVINCTDVIWGDGDPDHGTVWVSFSSPSPKDEDRPFHVVVHPPFLGSVCGITLKDGTDQLRALAVAHRQSVEEALSQQKLNLYVPTHGIPKKVSALGEDADLADRPWIGWSMGWGNGAEGRLSFIRLTLDRYLWRQNGDHMELTPIRPLAWYAAKARALSMEAQVSEYGSGAAIALTKMQVSLATRDIDGAFKSIIEHRPALLAEAKNHAAIADEIGRWQALDGMEPGEQKDLERFLKVLADSHKYRSEALTTLARAGRSSFIDSYNRFVTLENRSQEAERIADAAQK